MVEYKIIAWHVDDGPHAHNSHQKPGTVKKAGGYKVAGQS